MWAAVVTLFPDMIDAVMTHGVLSRAARRGQVTVETVNPRVFAGDRHATVDDSPYGGGPGMVLMAPPVCAAIAHASERGRTHTGGRPRVIHLSPQGRRFDQRRAREFARDDAPLVLVAGRYEGIDERVADRFDETLSVGDYVLTGGELAALTVIEAVARLQPGVLGNLDSVTCESFEDGLLDCPHYTRPVEFEGQPVPQVLLSGDHARVDVWRRRMRLVNTYRRRPDLLAGRMLVADERRWLEDYLTHGA